jgi:2-polyprenyl-6-methoxyphenol hydroxylase-like FAD-dependent oxidoreductase
LIAEGIDIQYKKTLTNISYSEDGTTVTAYFADGSSTNGSILVGTDGTRSVVRNLLLGPEKAALTTLEFAASIVQAKYTAEQVKFLRSWHPLYVAAPHPAGLLSWVGLHSAPDVDDPENWIMNHYISWPYSHAEQEESKDWTNETRLKQVKGFAKLFADPFKSAFAWLKDDQSVWYAPLTQWDPSLPEHRWDNHGGRVTLAGDAAHPMTFRAFYR